MVAGRTAVYFGDGSGVDQDTRAVRRATWALYRSEGEVAQSLQEVEDGVHLIPSSAYKRGALSGWFTTVPRSEIRAVLSFLEVAGPNSVYFGDCRYALEGVIDKVPLRLRSSQCGDADLWRIVKRQLD